MARWCRTHARFVLVLLLLAIAGCKVELNSNLQEEDANEALAKLLSNGILAEKQATEENRFKLLVDKDQFAVAVELLRSHGLPQRKYTSVADAFTGDGIVTSPTQEWIRYNHAISQQLSGTIASLPGVIAADVHIAQVKQEKPFEEVPKPTAAVMVQMDTALINDTIVPKIKQLVSFAVNELEYERVNVLLTPVTPIVKDTRLVSFAGLIVHERSVSLLRGVIVVAAIVFVGLACICMLALKNSRATPRKSEAP
ncbi:type III secretion system inner membrane ring lipoprotein SctJ [uncultured Roseibium sp.]|uniref:type III secretion system inner membrane ring lipoprotein SctJ n=1 Tax=uncultured Roseibium sp. TaxID=1936171 RepID=UPI0026070625|nr:type III secretion inner membrane ring lipoprotein SctJ [uncultured Roseibium sp.]